MSFPQWLLRSVKTVPGVDALVATPRYRRLRHRLTLLGPRRSLPFTQFLRVPDQFAALAGPVLRILRDRGAGADLRIVVVGCSTGAEAYTIASVLAHARPRLAFRIVACDLDPDLVARARAGRYWAKEVHDNPRVDADFIDRTFVRRTGGYAVRAELQDHVEFLVADLLDPALAVHLGSGDVVFAQNLLYHLRPAAATRAFGHLVSLTRRPGALFVDGMDLDLRERLTRRHELRPLDWRIREIHEQARAGRGDAYPFRYYGLEPLRPELRHWRHRYATIFLRG